MSFTNQSSAGSFAEIQLRLFRPTMLIQICNFTDSLVEFVVHYCAKLSLKLIGLAISFDCVLIHDQFVAWHDFI